MAKNMQYIDFDPASDEIDLFVASTERPRPNANQVLVEVAAFGINRADTLQRQGKYPPPPGESPILGLEVSGTIVECGDNVLQWQVGDAVCGLVAGGGYAQYTLLDVDLIMPIPKGVSLVDAAGLPEVFLTAHQALFSLARAVKGESILVHAGASGVGLAAIQLAKAAQCRVACTASSPQKLALCAQMGAEQGINYREQDYVDALKTSGFKADVVIDFVGGDYVSRNLSVLNLDGRMVYLAMLGGRFAQLDMAKVLAKRAQIMGSTLRNRDLAYKAQLVQDFCSRWMAAFEDGSLQVNIDSVLTIDDINIAHQRLENNQSQGKLIVRW